MSKRRRNHTPTFKARVALEAIKGEQTLSELTVLYGIHQNQIQRWKKQLIESSQIIFGSSEKDRKNYELELKELHAKIGQLTMERDFLSRAFGR